MKNSYFSYTTQWLILIFTVSDVGLVIRDFFIMGKKPSPSYRIKSCKMNQSNKNLLQNGKGGLRVICMHTSFNILPGWDVTSNIIPETEINRKCRQVWLHGTPGAYAYKNVQWEWSRNEPRVEVTSARKPSFRLRGNLCKNVMLSNSTVQWIPRQFSPTLIAEMGKSILALLPFNCSHLQEKID